MDDKQIFLSTDLAHRLAAIDIGSNSVRLMVAEPLRGGNYRILDEEREATRLGRSLSSTGTLDPEAVELTLAALRRFKQIASGYQVAESADHRHLRGARGRSTAPNFAAARKRKWASTSK